MTAVSPKDLKPLLLVQHRGALLKISTVYEPEPQRHVTAQVLVDYDGQVPGRTTVRHYFSPEIEQFVEPSGQLLNRYEDQTGQRAER